jgi:DNA-binding PadR family transcriptional regulator
MTGLTPTGRVILGMLAYGRNTGYEIKQYLDKTTRHFWAISYGQIYPELKRLEDQGLVVGRSDPAGARARTVFEITDAGRVALENWLGDTGEGIWELRCEAMLKLFFSDETDTETTVAQLRTFRTQQERKLEALRQLEPWAREGSHRGPYLSLQLGLAITTTIVNQCQELERQLTEDGSD